MPVDIANYRCKVTTGCGDAYSSQAALTLNTPLSITTQPTDKLVCFGSTATFGVAATGTGTLTYQWQKSTNSGSTWANVTDGSGGTTTTYTTPAMTVSMNGYKYRCVVTDSYGSLNSNAATLSLNGLPGISSQPTAATVCSGGTATFHVVGTGSPTLTYRWQKDLVDISDGGHYSGTSTATLTISSASSADAANYRCRVSSGCTPDTLSSEAALTLNTAPSITSQPSSISNACYGTTRTMSVTATGAGTLTYQWQKNSANLSNDSNYQNVTTATLSLTNISSTHNGSYRCIVTGTCGSVTSNTATVTTCANTSVLTQPSGAMVNVGSTATFQTTAVGCNQTYQWQKSTNGGSTWADVTDGSGGTTYTYTTPTTTAGMNGYKYRCYVVGTCGSVYSNGATLTVVTTPVITTQPLTGGTCLNFPTPRAVVFTVAATGPGGLAYQWQKDEGWGFYNISDQKFADYWYVGTGTPTLTVTSITSTAAQAYFRCVVSNSYGSTASNQAYLHVYTALTCPY